MTNSLEECSSQTVYCESDNEVRHTRVQFDIVIRDGFEKHKKKHCYGKSTMKFILCRAGLLCRADRHITLERM